MVNFFPLNASMRDQVEKLEGLLDVCIIQSVVEEGNKKVTILKNARECCLLFGHPEVFVDCSNVRLGKSTVQALVVDTARLIL